MEQAKLYPPPTKEVLQQKIDEIIKHVSSPHLFYDSEPGRQNIRNVRFGEYGSCECNAIHVEHLSDIGSIIIEDLRFEDNLQKITFRVEK
jgi:Ser-tRNA(Ala) deacylase AlaX